MPICLKHSCSWISIHVPTRGTTRKRSDGREISTDFNPRSHTGNDTSIGRMRWRLSDFNPRSRTGERRKMRRCRERYSQISIHVPTRGTTPVLDGCAGGCRISIHVPARGTTMMGVKVDFPKEFQSTFPHGERHKPAEKAQEKEDVSIHVPARGTTKMQTC